MDIRQLNYLVALEKHLNFTRAAEEVHIAQTSLSQQISVLENQLGVKLFNRNNRSVSLTPAGMVFIDDAKLIIAKIEEAVNKARQAAACIAGNLTIGWWGSYEMMCLHTVVGKFHSIYPNVTFTFYQDKLNSLLSALKNQLIDILFIPLHFFKDTEGLSHITIHSSPLCISVGKNHPLAKEKKVAPEALTDEKFIIINFNKTPGAYEKMLWQCNTMGFTPNIIHQPQFFQEVELMVDLGMGITVNPKCLEKDYQSKLSFISVEGQEVDTEVEVTWLENSENPLVSLFTSMLNDKTINP
jgi:LysR family transcriptional activator of glutamate synthase operon